MDTVSHFLDSRGFDSSPPGNSSSVSSQPGATLSLAGVHPHASACGGVLPGLHTFSPPLLVAVDTHVPLPVVVSRHSYIQVAYPLLSTCLDPAQHSLSPHVSCRWRSCSTLHHGIPSGCCQSCHAFHHGLRPWLRGWLYVQQAMTLGSSRPPHTPGAFPGTQG